MIPVLIGLTLITFLLLNVVPGDPVVEMLGKRADEKTIQIVREKLGLNDPLHVQYFRFLWNALHGDLGESFKLRQPGRLAIMALSQRDYPLIQGTVLFSALVFCLGVLIVDISYAYLDPRIRLH